MNKLWLAPQKKAKALRKSLNELIRDYLQKLAGGCDPERLIVACTFGRDINFGMF